MNIRKIWSLEILDSRGFPTLKTFVELESGAIGWSAIPSGASTGTYEAHELRDNDPKRYAGKGVLKAKHNVDIIINDILKGKSAIDQKGLDQKMIQADGTENKTKLGANAILSVSLAISRAVAIEKKIPLYKYLGEFFNTSHCTMPVPMINVINGGKHADLSADFQEYMLIPHGFSKFSEALRACVETFQELKKRLAKDKQPTSVGDEGGFAPNLKNNREPLQLLVDAIDSAGYVPGDEIAIGMDIAANEFFTDGKYNLKTENKKLTRNELIKYYTELIDEFPVYSIEDPFAEDDWQGFVDLYQTLDERTQIVGDDLYVTNPKRLKKGIGLNATNAILIKLNQIGTLTETIEVIKLAKETNQQTIISHRSGETEDPFIADLVIAAEAGQIKTGSMARSERLVKYNRLLEIEQYEKELNPNNLTYFQFPYKPNGSGY